MNTEVKPDSQVLDKLVSDLKQGFGSLAEKVKGDRAVAIELMKQAFAKAEKEELALAKAADLKKVKELCKKHGFSASSLKGYLVTRAPKKTVLDKGNAK
jgi:hypothetical protein